MPTNDEYAESVARGVSQVVVAETKKVLWLVQKDMDSRPGSAMHTAYTSVAQATDRIAGALAGKTACGAGCSNCCHIPALISGYEAGILAKRAAALGVHRTKPRYLITAGDTSVYRYEAVKMTEFMGRPCPFLDATTNACSVYDERPLVCRLHYNITTDSSLCDISKPDQMVPNIDFTAMEYGVLGVWASFGVADIRDFFAKGE